MSHLACADTPEHPLNREPARALRALRRLPAAGAGAASPPRRASSSAASSTTTCAGRASRSTASRRRRASPTRCGRWLGCKAPILPGPRRRRWWHRWLWCDLPLRAGSAPRDGRRSDMRTVIMRALGNRGERLYRRPERADCRPGLHGSADDRHQRPAAGSGAARHEGRVHRRPHDPVDKVAAEAGTIGYEMLTRLGRRFARRYIARRAAVRPPHHSAGRHRPRLPLRPCQRSGDLALFTGRALLHCASAPYYPRTDRCGRWSTSATTRCRSSG